MVRCPVELHKFRQRSDHSRTRSVQLPTGSARIMSGSSPSPSPSTVDVNALKLQQKHDPATSPTSKPCIADSEYPPDCGLVIGHDANLFPWLM